jgi:hypothetical protein
MNLHQMGAEKMPVKMPETFDSMRISSIFHNPSFTDSGVISYRASLLRFFCKWRL